MGASNISRHHCMGGWCTQRRQCAHHMLGWGDVQDGNLCAAGTHSAFAPMPSMTNNVAEALVDYAPPLEALVPVPQLPSAAARPRAQLRTQPHSRWPSNSLI